MCIFLDMNIETIIYMFYKLWCTQTPGSSLMSIEHPKGEYFLFLLLFLGMIHRLRLRCADFLHILYIDILTRGFLLHDICAIIGNLDVVFGSVDR